MKRVISILLVLMLIVSAMPFGAFTLSVGAEDTIYTEGCYTYTVSNGEATITRVDTSISGDVVIPDALGGCQVIGIGYNAFFGCNGIASITIPSSVTSIAASAFSNCTSLTSINIPDSVTSIGFQAFNNTSYYNDDSNWQDEILYIGKHLVAARDTITGDYDIKTGTKTIADNAFYDCSKLTEVVIPQSVTDIGEGVFKYCDSLAKINVDKSNNNYCDIDNILFDKSVTTLIQYPRKKVDTSYVIPDTVTRIKDGGFYECRNLTNVVMPKGIICIERDAFYWCYGLTSITIPDTVIDIGDSAFYNCSALGEINIPETVERIGAWAFHGTLYYQTASNWQDETLYIGKHLIKVKDTITGDYDIKAETRTIAGAAFYECDSLTSVNIPDGVISIGDEAFFWCRNLISVNIPNSVISIGEKAFDSCENLTNITIPDSVTSIGDNAFCNCDSITDIVITDNVINIGKGVFANCDNLADITLPFVPGGYLGYIFGAESYLGNKNAPRSLNTVVISSMCNVLPAHAFHGCDYLTNITLDSVISIGDSAFEQCVRLTNLDMGNNCIEIGDRAFYLCESLTNITIPDSVTSIGDNAFCNCDSITDIVIADNVINIGKGVFANCDNLADITLPFVPDGYLGYLFGASSYKFNNKYISSSLKTVILSSECKEIPRYAFYDCDNLQSISIGENVTSIGSYAFAECDGIINIIIPGNVIKIDYNAFYKCFNLESVVIKSGTTKICDRAFYDCIRLSNVTIPVSLKNIEEYAFCSYKSSLADVWYAGSEKDRESIVIESRNDDLLEATWHYNSCIGSEVHTYDDANDLICNVCGVEKQTYISGDASGDGQINNRDLALLMQFLNGWEVEVNEQAGDVNADGAVNNRDYALLMQYVNGWDVELQ